MKRKPLKEPARKIWSEIVAKRPSWTEFELEILASYANLRADYDANPSTMPSSRIVEMRRQARFLLATHSKVKDDGAKAR
jgi:hypothetical protein